MMGRGKSRGKQTRPGHGRRQFIERCALTSAGAPDPANLSSEGKGASRTYGAMPVPMRDVNGKVAFVTGGSSGIGLGIARAFAEAGMKVAIGYRSEAHLKDALEYLGRHGPGVHAINVDVTDRPGMAAAAVETVRVFGKVHVLVNNAGVAVLDPVVDTSYEDWDLLIATNLTGVFNGIRAFLPHILAHGNGGQVITTSSVMGLFTVQNHGSYSASKFGVVGLMEALRLELLSSNIGASVFCPGNVWANLRAPTQSSEESRRIIDEARRIAPDRAMDPLEAGQLVLRGMRSNDLYILTHPEFEEMINERHEAIAASTPNDLRAPQARAEIVKRAYNNPIYKMARNQKLSLSTHPK